MPQPKIRSPLIAGLGLRAFKGGAVAVGVTVAKGEPCVVLSTVLETSTQSDRLSFEPYRLAAETQREPTGGAAPEAIAIVAEGRRRQNQLATNSLQAIIHRLDAAGCRPAVVALLVNRAGWITDLLEYSLAWAEHVPIAETMAVREALRFAVGQCGVDMVDQEEKSLPELATKVLGVSSAELDNRLKLLGAPVGRPWRKEQKLACLSAWVTLANRSVAEIDQPG
ncbi:hypothetical protein [Dyella nitratireducens]|uniref:Uncharacterized protein n=1 Tax=Dyella nitratireducens TaxID=1849580 RepID=A0ABQ1FSQ1_9GAMM|nr:hypothetical protein [Dyella nitratireducens]GGA29574.1 hypothetical protein GCM10010981_18160 [Dyella nitratireducens]GLQ43120.1 hypothetical protein GCM10007902_29700 [Dyella nitratireducens]